ncbi:hypothetical protein [Lutimaribacter pacificus]|nr:hypothetical protein [Lutimaribacter pacificus]
MGKAEKTFARMAANPRDWKINDIKSVCRRFGLFCDPPSSGSHYKVYSDYLEGMLTIPAHRPIKPIYIKQFVSYAKAHRLKVEEQGNG